MTIEEENNAIVWNNICKLDVEELSDLLYNYWYGLKRESNNELGKPDYMMDECARIKMSQVIKLRNIIQMKVDNKL